MKEKLQGMEQLKEWIAAGRRIVFFGGAGTSTESGIPDFRSEAGLFQTREQEALSPEKILSASFFRSRPGEFYRFYFKQMIHTDARPNRAHLALAELERRGQLRTIITQNIDGLHQLAGSKQVLELHGTVHRNTCLRCGDTIDLAAMLELARANEDGLPRCPACSGLMKPDVVLYEENLRSDVLEASVEAITEADVLIVGGTSLTVHPAAGLIRYYRGSRLVLINRSPTDYDRYAQLVISDGIGRVLGDAVLG